MENNNKKKGIIDGRSLSIFEKYGLTAREVAAIRDGVNINAETPNGRTLYNYQSMAKYLKKEVGYLHRLVFQKRIPHIRIHGLILFDLAQIDKWFAEHEVLPEVIEIEKKPEIKKRAPKNKAA